MFIHWFDIDIFFPNLNILAGTGWYLTYNFYPISVNETYWEINNYRLPAKTPSEKIAHAYASAQRDVLYEDLSTMEGVQQGMDSGALKALFPGDLEAAIRHQAWAVEQWINRP